MVFECSLADISSCSLRSGILLIPNPVFVTEMTSLSERGNHNGSNRLVHHIAQQSHQLGIGSYYECNKFYSVACGCAKLFWQEIQYLKPIVQRVVNGGVQHRYIEWTWHYSRWLNSHTGSLRLSNSLTPRTWLSSSLWWESFCMWPLTAGVMNTVKQKER